MSSPYDNVQCFSKVISGKIDGENFSEANINLGKLMKVENIEPDRIDYISLSKDNSYPRVKSQFNFQVSVR